MLKTARERLIITPVTISSSTGSPCSRLKPSRTATKSKAVKTSDKIRFETGPAPATRICPFASSPGRKFRDCTGVGLAHPRRGMPAGPKIWIRGMSTVPNRSMCTRGLRLTRPRSRAVLSPMREAIQACADSWNDRLNKRTTNDMRPCAISGVSSNDAPPRNFRC